MVAVDFGPDGLLYALELSDAARNPGPNAGKVVRVLRSGELEDVITGLSLPTGMTFGTRRPPVYLKFRGGSAGHWNDSAIRHNPRLVVRRPAASADLNASHR